MERGAPSVTARRVAAHRLGFERVVAPGRPQDDKALATDVAHGVVVGDGPMREYLRARTAFFDRAVVRAVDGGWDPVVIVGAGYDGRAWRFAREGVRFFEVDHPATQVDKRARAARLGIADDAVTFVPVDLTAERLAERLAAAGLAASRPSCAVVEGLCAYLEPEVVARLFVELRRAVAPGSPLAVSVGIARTGDPEREARVAWFLARVAELGEPVRSELDADEARPLLERAGWGPEHEGPPGAGRDAALGLVLAVATT